MTLDRKDYKSAIPQLEKRLSEVEKIGKDAFNKFEDIAHKTQLDAAEAEKKVLALDYQMDTLKVVTEYAIVPTGYDPDDWSGTTWDTTMPNLDADSFAPTTQYPNGFTLWARSKTYRNDIVVQYTDPQPVELMDGVFTFVNTVASNAGWTTINGSTVTTGKITSVNGKCYFDLDTNNFQMKDGTTLDNSSNALAWDNGRLFVKGKMAIANEAKTQLYYTEMTGGGFDIVANDVNLAHIGYASGAGESGTATAPYYTLGTRASDTSAGDRGNYSVAEGLETTASGFASHAEGFSTVASGRGAHAEGEETLASKGHSHAEGYLTIASNHHSHAEGEQTTASGMNSHAQNFYTNAGFNNQTAIGKYNNNISTNAFEIGNGNGPGSSARSNAFAVDWNGVARLNGNLFTGCSSDSTGGYEFGRKTGNHVVIGGIHVCWGQVSLTCSADAYTETTVTLPYTYSSAPYVFTGFAARNANARSTMGTNGGLALNKIYVGCVSTSARDQTVVWMTIGA